MSLAPPRRVVAPVPRAARIMATCAPSCEFWTPAPCTRIGAFRPSVSNKGRHVRPSLSRDLRQRSDEVCTSARVVGRSGTSRRDHLLCLSLSVLGCVSLSSFAADLPVDTLAAACPHVVPHAIIGHQDWAQPSGPQALWDTYFPYLSFSHRACVTIYSFRGSSCTIKRS